MGTENSGPSGGISGLAAQYGVAPTMSGGAYADPEDLPVLVERKSQTPVGAAEIGQASGGWKETPSVRPVEKRTSELEKEFWGRDEGEVPELQRRLWAGGFYPPGANPEDVVLGDRDPYTEKAWSNALDRAAKFRRAGRDLTLDEVIDMGANIRGGKDGAGPGSGGGGGGRAPLVTELANPEDLKYYAQKTAVATLGRSLKPDELERFVSSFHGSQSAAQAQAYNAGGTGGPGGAVVSAPSPNAAAESFARQAAPVEAGAHDAVRVFDTVSKLLGGRRGSR